MTKPKIISETPITMSELKSELDEIKKRDGELNFRAGKTEEYLNQFVTVSKKKADEIKNKIEELNVPRLKPEHITKLIDLMPSTVEGIKIIFQGQPLTITNDNIKKIANVMKESAEK